MLLWNGSCQVHEIFSERELIRLKTRHPEALLLAHPECREEILRHADHIGSTTSIIKVGSESDKKEFIIATEPHLIHQMKKTSPEKTFLPAPGTDGPLVPGDPERAAETARAAQGIPLVMPVVEDLRTISRATGIALD